MSRFTQAISLFILVMLGTISAVAAETMQLVVGRQTRTALLERPAGQGPRPTIIMLHMADGTAAGIDGRRKHYADVRPGLTHRQPTCAGHVWVVVEGGKVLGAVVAGESAGRVEINPPSAAPGANSRSYSMSCMLDPMLSPSAA